MDNDERQEPTIIPEDGTPTLASDIPELIFCPYFDGAECQKEKCAQYVTNSWIIQRIGRGEGICSKKLTALSLAILAFGEQRQWI